MERFEYKVIPAPRDGIRVKGVKGPAAKFAAALEASMNSLAADGWEYVRAETLPADERHGLTRRKTETTQNVLIFRRLQTEDARTEEPVIAPIIATRDEDAESIFDETEEDDFPEEETESEEDTKS